MEIDLDLIDIGNSKGIRLPKALIEACGFKKTIHVDFKDGKLILMARRQPRHGWDDLLKKAAVEDEGKKDDLQDLRELPNDFDMEEWTW